MVAVAWVILAAQQRQVDNLPFTMPEVFFPGQREVVLGPLPYRDTTMSMIYSKEYPTTADMKGINPPGWDEYPLGNVRWIVRNDTFAGKPCMVIRSQGLYMPKYNFTFKGGFRKVTETLNLKGVCEWWVSPDGTIIRQYEQRSDSRGVCTANCTYDKDSINVQVDIYGKRTVTTLYPGDMDMVQNQFKPMVVDGKVVMREKAYLVYDPFNGGFKQRKATFGGHFAGVYLSINFTGIHIDFDGMVPEGPVKAYIDDEGDLVKLDLPNDRYVNLGVVPPGKEKKV